MSGLCGICRQGSHRVKMPKPAPQVVAECNTCDMPLLKVGELDAHTNVGHDVREVKP